MIEVSTRWILPDDGQPFVRPVKLLKMIVWRGGTLALRTNGYVQNPAGESISEAAQPLLALLNSDGSLAQNLGYIGGPRHNQLTTIAPLNGHWLLGGMINGPGTHSGDAQRELIVADGFLREGSNCQPSELRLCPESLLHRQ